jgi:hypothetical protein
MSNNKRFRPVCFWPTVVGSVVLFGAFSCAAPKAITVSADLSPSSTLAPQQASSGNCHPSYAGKCVPIASDADCVGGQGNGPVYVTGPVYVVGPDVYDLDRDRDGVACEPWKRR